MGIRLSLLDCTCRRSSILDKFLKYQSLRISGDYDGTLLLLSETSTEDLNQKYGGERIVNIIADYDHVEGLKILFEKGVALDSPTDNGWTALHHASYKMTKFLLEHGVSPTLPNKYGDTPLHCLCSYDDVNDEVAETILLLLSHGADLTFKNNLGKTPGDFFLEKQKITLAHWALSAKTLDLFQYVIRCSTALNSIVYGATLLIFAMRKKNFDAVRMILNEGADVNAPDENGNTPLHWAIILRSTEMAKLFIECGANPYSCNR